MSIFTWVVLGLIAGFVGSKLIVKGESTLVDIVLGTVGALVAGFVFTKADVLGLTMGDVYTMGIALLGSMIILFTYHKILKH
jgi:uncharacterized membrane protein YeaQ/YmgE (transglycosylase-associated protein family)